ncbi:uncharacterized protein LOC18026626 [Eutrema salsugineum]|uniref:uncharacterized protein LOC18026626 n=1 Tax=Eutrema salsugineum TaxID=72664 RepID=UPI000CED309D|nr:uncharacterized protein LOC18026626 [Eutrema salsugineum]
MESQKEIWELFQELHIGANQLKWVVHEDAQRKFENDHRLYLVARDLNPNHQNPVEIKALMPKVLSLIEQVKGQVNEDDTINFYFTKEHHLLTVLDNGPYSYQGWIIALDRCNHRHYPNFLQEIPFWVKIKNIPSVFRRTGIANNIASNLGQVRDVIVIEQTVNQPGEVWAKADFDVDSEITRARQIQITSHSQSVELEF